jgi:hypothetical protein
MASRDLHNSIKVSRGISPVAITTGNATLTSEIIDTQGFESLEFAALSGAITDGTFTGTVYHGDASNMSDEAATTDLVGSAPVFAATDDNVTKKVGYIGNKRYVRIKFVQTGATTGGFLTCVAIQSHAKNAPVA